MLDHLEERAALYLLRQEQGDWSLQDQQELDDWLQESMRHKAVYWRLQHGWAEADRIRSLNLPPAPVVDSSAFLKRNWLKAAALIAALLVPLVLATMTVSDWNNAPNYTRYATQVGQRTMIAFPDGTKIDLNTDSVIRVKWTEKRRVIHLDRGEAFFDVAHNAKWPFYVFTGDRQIKVLGTKFAIRKEGTKTIASVVEGRVQFGRMVNGATRDTLTLKRGDFSISQGSQTLTIYDKLDTVTNNLGWMRGLLIFDRISLSEAARQFNRYNTRQLVIADKRIAAVKIGGAFRPQNVETFARLMADAYGMRIEETESEIRITED